MTFGNLVGLWLGLPLLGIIYLVFRQTRDRKRIYDLLAKSNGTNFSSPVRFISLKAILFLVGIVSLWIAFLAPQWGEQEQIVPQTGRDIVIALDISKSMLAEDLKPNRFDFAKQKIKRLINDLAGDSVGLVIFAADSLVVCPLTCDRAILDTFVDDVAVQTISGGSTNLARAINTAVKMMEKVEYSRTKLVAIFTDGEDFSDDLQMAGKNAQAAGIRIFTFGVATLNGAPIPKLDLQGKMDGFIKSRDGSVVISRLNEKLLQEISLQCGGEYAVVDQKDHSDITQAMRWVNQFERSQSIGRVLHTKIERYYYFAGLALLLLLIEWLI